MKNTNIKNTIVRINKVYDEIQYDKPIILNIISQLISELIPCAKCLIDMNFNTVIVYYDYDCLNDHYVIHVSKNGIYTLYKSIDPYDYRDMSEELLVNCTKLNSSKDIKSIILWIYNLIYNYNYEEDRYEL